MNLHHYCAVAFTSCEASPTPRQSPGSAVCIMVTPAFPSTRPQDRMIFGILATLAEFERELIREYTKAGMGA